MRMLIEDGVFPGLGNVNALLKNVKRQTGAAGAYEAMRLVNSGEWVLIPRKKLFAEADGIFYFSVTSHGTSGPDWLSRLQSQNFLSTKFSRDLLNSSNFVATQGATYNLAVIPGEKLDDERRSTNDILTEGARRRWTHVPVEAGCLMLDMIKDADLDHMRLLRVVAMHKEFQDSSGNSELLCARHTRDSRWISCKDEGFNGNWRSRLGFMFLVSQVDTE